jgi:hypothetical protein
MRRPPLALAVAALAAIPLLTPRTALAEDAPDWAGLLEQKSQAVVSVKFVLKMRLDFGGQTQENEENGEIRGVVADASGLVMISNDALEGNAGMFRRMMARRPGGGGGHGVTASPTDLKVLFGSESKEHDAVLVARDSNLGLAFVQILDLEGKTPPTVDLAKGVEPKVGQTLAVVGRHGRGFDCAPTVDRLQVTGRIEKPRPMWSVSGAGRAGLPAYDAQGRIVGVLAVQSGSAGVEDGGPMGGGEGIFLLTLENVQRVLEQAKKRVPEAVAKAKEAAAKEAEAGMAEAAPSDTPKAPESPKAPEAPSAPEAPKGPGAPK